MQWAGFAGIAPRAVFLPVIVRPQMLVIMAGMDQKERYVAPCRKLWIFRGCCSSTRSSISLSWCRRRFPWSCCSEDHRKSTVAPQHGDRCPCCTGRAGSLVSGSHVLWSSPVEYRIMDFLGDPRNVRTQLSLVRQWIRVWRQSTRRLDEFHMCST